MVKAEIYKGIEYVRISKLPDEQASQIRNWSRFRKISIQTDKELFRDCIQYRDYKSWYEHYYDPSPHITVAVQSEKTKATKRNLSFNLSRIFNFLLSKN